MKVIFLDIDGVLATYREFNRNQKSFWKKYPEAKRLGIEYPFNDGCVKILNEIIERTEATIVLSSDWRLYYNLDDLHYIFKFNKLDVSPTDMTEYHPTSFSQLDKNRAHEIGLYIGKHPEITSWVAIDDLNMKPWMSITNEDHKMFVTRQSEGLKMCGLKEKIIKQLNG